jgi:glycosyltransferase involved in cell wall biosynthesis
MDQKTNTAQRRVLLFSYAFPPMRVQMTPAVTKAMAGISRLGYEIDVLTAGSFEPFLKRDDSLLPYCERHFARIFRLEPSRRVFSKLGRWTGIWHRLPDLMMSLREKAVETLMDMDLSIYEAVITWSPFHSINCVMAEIKRDRSDLRWIAQFSDPWARNPLEKNPIVAAWNWWHESRTVERADFIIHSSKYARNIMLGGRREDSRALSTVIPHPFEPELFPARKKMVNEKITLRHVGVLFDRRSPEPFFVALAKLLARRQELQDQLVVELVGPVPLEMLSTPGVRTLPVGMVRHVPTVSYIESLEKMFDADILLLIEAETKLNLFVPSKLSDYMGAGTPIVGIAPPGASEDMLRQLGCWLAKPNDTDGIERAIEGAVDYVQKRLSHPWCNEEYRKQFANEVIASQFVDIVEGLKH